MLLKDLIKLPEKKWTPEEPSFDLGFDWQHGYNKALKQIGNISVELDVDKIRDLIHHHPLMEKLMPSEVVFLVQHLADNIKEIIKKKE